MKKHFYLIVLLFMIMITPIVGMDFDSIRAETFEYKYAVLSTQDERSDKDLSQFYFHYYEPFFFDSDNVASFFQASNGWLSVGIKKWDFDNYNLAFGILYKQLNKFNQAPQFYDGYQFNNDNSLEGIYSEWEFFSDVILSDNEKITLSYANRNNRYSISGNAPANFVLPENNTVHSLSGELRHLDTNNEQVEFKALKLLYGFSDKSKSYGIDNSNAQFEKIVSLKGRWFASKKVEKNQTLLVGATGILSVKSPERIGGSSLGDSKYEARLYGFSENELPVNSAIIGRFDYFLNNLFGSIFSVTFNNSFAVFNRDANQLQLNQFGMGSGFGTTFPVSFPLIGTYNFDFSYQLAFKNSFNQPHNHQFLFGMSSAFSW